MRVRAEIWNSIAHWAVISKAGMISVLDETSTPMGARLLRQWIDRPLTNLDSLNERQNAVQSLFDDRDTLEALRIYLAGVRDMERMLTRIVLDRASPRDYRGLAEALLALPDLCSLIANRSGLFADMAIALQGLEELADEMDKAIVEMPPPGISRWRGDAGRALITNWIDCAGWPEMQGTGCVIMKPESVSEPGWPICG